MLRWWLLIVYVLNTTVVSWFAKKLPSRGYAPSIAMSTAAAATKLSQFCEKKILLGSGSFTRKLILKNAGFTFTVVKPDIDEKALGDRTSADKAAELVTLVAHAKVWGESVYSVYSVYSV